MLPLVLTSYLFVQGPCLWAWPNFFLSQRLSPVFDHLVSFYRLRFSRFPKTVMKKVITHNFNTVNVLSSFSFLLFTFEFNHVLPFPGFACYYAEVLGLLL